jgi:hypothetical protein
VSVSVLVLFVASALCFHSSSLA